MRRCDRHVVILAGLLAALLIGAGCTSLPYLLHLAEGQLSTQGESTPIPAVLAAGTLDEEATAKLELIVRARDYAADVIGLNAGTSYTTFYDTAGAPLAFNLSAARRDRLEAYTWTFPIVGTVPYLSFFDEEYLRAFEQQLQDAGYDTLTYELDAYSTLGILEDPVRSPMLRRNALSLVETIIHELLHNTVWRPNATTFNESLATFVGRQGAVDFLRAEFGDESGWPQLAEELYADRDTVNAFLVELYADLEAYYAQPISAAEKIAGRAAVYEAARQRFVDEVQPTLTYPDSYTYLATLPTNNAWLLANYRYNLDLDLMAQVHEATGGDWGATLAVFRAAARDAGDPFAYLREWLVAESPNRQRGFPRS